ncbi:NUDIX hydrolase [Gemmobacter sp.]|uniref:NUDIX hydrolase n=1 Tax=Gemmobacter sp. TaxID=1898957 RepID=UPI002AFE6D0C|nr:NUDIX hydrolase [Gemmobacter sp.]
MIRRIDQPPQPGRRYRRRPGAYAVLMRQGRVLLTHQAEPWPEYQLPGGGIDPGEHPVPALHREVAEETGWTMQLIQRLGAFRRFTYMPEYDLWAEKLCTVYLARPILRLGPPTEPGHSAIWTTPQQAVRMLANPGDRMFLSALL